MVKRIGLVGLLTIGAAAMQGCGAVTKYAAEHGGNLAAARVLDNAATFWTNAELEKENAKIIAQGNNNRTRGNNNGNASGPFWTHRPVAHYEKTIWSTTKGNKRGFLSVYEKGIQFIGENGSWTSIPYSNIMGVESTDLLFERDWLDILTPTKKYHFEIESVICIIFDYFNGL